MAMTPEQESMVQKILKLMELGKSETNEHIGETTAANAMAAKLMAKYSIDFADLRAGKVEKGMFNEFDLPIDSDVDEWERSLANGIAIAFDVRLINKRYDNQLAFLGTQSDIDITVFFFRYLRRAVGMQSERSYTRKADRTTFAYGMVAEISRRMKLLYDTRNAAFDTGERGLMVIKTDGLAKFVKEQFPVLRQAKNIKLTGSREAHAAGTAAGKKVNISRPLGGGTPASTGKLK